MEAVPPIVLRPPRGGRPFEADRRPATGLPGCSHLWSVRYALPPGVTHRQEVLSLPAVNLTVEWDDGGGRALVYGPITGRYVRTLAGRSLTVAVQFLPGAFGGAVPAAELVDRVLPAADVLGPWAAADHATLDELAAALRAHLDPPPAGSELVTDAVRLAADDSELTRVADLAARLGVTPRTLQRRFEQHLGVGPKWVLCRARVTDLLATLEAGGELDLAEEALRLGFADQAHLTNAFTRLVGVAPGAYRRRIRHARAR